MPPSRRNKAGLLARVNFPLYSVQMLTSRHILVAGGGGSANTGVANGFEIFELSHDGKKFVCEEVARHETGPSVVMNCATHVGSRHLYLAAGQESHCQIYRVLTKVVDPEDLGGSDFQNGGAGTTLRRRRQTSTSSENGKVPDGGEPGGVDRNCNAYKQLDFDIKPMLRVQTDFSDDEPLQRVVRIGRPGHLVATGGTDGHVRLWSFPQLNPIRNWEGHSGEIDDLDLSPDEKMLISIAKDGQAKIWNTKTGKLARKLEWKPPENSKYLYKRCRFGINEVTNDKWHLFTITNPAGRSSLPAALQLWDPLTGELKKQVTRKEALSALAVSDNGRFIAIGTMFSGSVEICIAFSLQCALRIEGAHSMFVTGLEFVPTNTDNLPISCNSEASVISISVDNQVCIHSLSQRSTLPAWLVIILIVGCLFFTFMLCSILGL